MRPAESEAPLLSPTDPTGLRQLHFDDAEQVAALYARAFGDWRRLDAEEIRLWIRNEELKPELLRVLEIEGCVVGYGDIEIHEDEVTLDVAAPEHWEPFFDWAEDIARTSGPPRVHAYFPADHELAGLVSKRGYRLWRSSVTMEMSLEAGGPAALPPGLQLYRYRPEVDEAQLRAAINETFADDPFHHDLSVARFREFYLNARGHNPSLWLLAWEETELAGFALAYPQRESDSTLGWISNLGVRAPWRRRGLGEALLRAAFRELHACGLRRVGLGVDLENDTGALNLYERVGMHAVARGDNWWLDLPAAPGSR